MISFEHQNALVKPSSNYACSEIIESVELLFQDIVLKDFNLKTKF